MKQPLIIFGTRPEYLKIKSLVILLEEKKIPFILLQVLQHEQLEVEEKNKPFYKCVKLLPNDTVTRLTCLASEISLRVEPFILTASCVFIQGDTATAFFTALSAFHNSIPIFHIEAGLRTYDLQNPFPEEAYRSMISRIATYHLCPDEAAKRNLEKEGIHKNLFVVGNTILDLVKSYTMTRFCGTVVPITIHRRENWENLPQIVKAVHTLALWRPDLDFVWIYHPNPALQKVVNDTLKTLEVPSNMWCEQPCSHKQLCKYIHEAYCLITDSGGIQEEASFVGKYCYVLRKTTERSSIPPLYLTTIARPEELVPEFKKRQMTLLASCTVYGTGYSSEQIATILKDLN
jgi:UDP-N-acetylglucosamine 2-epimerase (non-hydrolysing)